MREGRRDVAFCWRRGGNRGPTVCEEKERITRKNEGGKRERGVTDPGSVLAKKYQYGPKRGEQRGLREEKGRVRKNLSAQRRRKGERKFRSERGGIRKERREKTVLAKEKKRKGGKSREYASEKESQQRYHKKKGKATSREEKKKEELHLQLRSEKGKDLRKKGGGVLNTNSHEKERRKEGGRFRGLTIREEERVKGGRKEEEKEGVQP